MANDSGKEHLTAYCPHCIQDRPIERQTFNTKCPFCHHEHDRPHDVKCRGPVAGALDVCTFCNQSLFAKALDKARYDFLEEEERRMDCSSSIFARHGANGVDADTADAILNTLRSGQIIQAIKQLRVACPQFGLAEAKNVIDSVRGEMGGSTSLPNSAKPSGGCATALVFLPMFFVVFYLISRI